MAARPISPCGWLVPRNKPSSPAASAQSRSDCSRIGAMPRPTARQTRKKTFYAIVGLGLTASLPVSGASSPSHKVILYPVGVKMMLARQLAKNAQLRFRALGANCEVDAISRRF